MKAAGVRSAWTGINWVLNLFGFSVELEVTARRHLKGMEKAEVAKQERGSLVPHDWFKYDAQMLAHSKGVNLCSLVAVVISQFFGWRAHTVFDLHREDC